MKEKYKMRLHLRVLAGFWSHTYDTLYRFTALVYNSVQFQKLDCNNLQPLVFKISQTTVLCIELWPRNNAVKWNAVFQN